MGTGAAPCPEGRGRLMGDRHGAAPDPRVRFVLPPREQLSEEQAELVERIAGGPRAQQAGVVPLTDGDGRLSGVFSLMPIAPAVGDRVQAVGAALRFETRLAPLTRELAILTVAVDRASDFEWFAHERAALEAGATPEQLDAVRRGATPEAVPAETRAALVALAELLRDGALGDAGYRAALGALGAERLAELVWLQGYYAMLATALATFRPPLPPGADGVLTGRVPADPAPES